MRNQLKLVVFWLQEESFYPDLALPFLFICQTDFPNVILNFSKEFQNRLAMNESEDVFSDSGLNGLTDQNNDDISPEQELFDREKFWLVSGAGLVLFICGLFLIGKTKNAPSETINEIPVKAVEIVPRSAADLAEFVLGNILLFAGVVCVFWTLRMLLRYILGRKRK